MSPDQYENTVQHAEMLAQVPATAAGYLPQGRAVQAGERFVQRDLAASLRAIAEHGRDAFYKGDIAERIASYLQGSGGLLTKEDFAEHSGEWVTPLMGSYRGHEVYQVPPNSQGLCGANGAANVGKL